MFRHILVVVIVGLLLGCSICAPRRRKRRDNVDERGSYFEGDIRLTQRQERLARGGSLNYATKWPNGRVYYTISNQFSSYEINIINGAIREFEQKSCIRWIPRSHQQNYVHFFKGDGCWANLGRVGGQQNISLGERCPTSGIVRHEMLHALGFHHEHSRSDRDEYVTILWDNILDDKGHNFEKRDTRNVFPYDFDKSQLRTIEAKDPNISNNFGQRNGFSTGDLADLNDFYNCHTTFGLKTSTTRGPNLKTPTPNVLSTTKRTTVITFTSFLGSLARFLNILIAVIK